MRAEALGQSPWRRKCMGHGKREQESWGKPRFVKVWGCQPQFGARFGGRGGSLGLYQGVRPPDVA
jgi:hypothetical protein